MNKKSLPVILLAVIVSIALFSCSKSRDDKYAGDYSRGYFPLDFGKYVIYDVDSTIWDDFLQVKSIHKYQMRYSVQDTFRDNENRLSYRLDVLIRNSDSLAWHPHRVLYVTPTASTLEYVEDNLRFIKLVFPITSTTSWKGNSLIPSADQDYTYFFGWTYHYSNYTQPFNDGKVNFENTVTVSQVDEHTNDPELQPGDYADKTYGYEVYAYDIGLVYREFTHWTYDPAVATFRKGYSVIMRAVDHN
jgi:hypothetical protein